MDQADENDVIAKRLVTSANVLSFCTIVTHSHFYFAKVLFSSLQKHLKEGYRLRFFVLVVDADVEDSHDAMFELVGIKEISTNAVAKQIITKYSANMDKLRWCLKPALLHFLIKKWQIPVIYADSDLYFFSDYSFLNKILDTENCLLSPHFRAQNPWQDEPQFLKNFTDGFFNGGLVGASYLGLPILEWWMNACLYACEQTSANGLFDDQKYLDFIPVRFQGVHILRHMGCNVAAWNLTDCKRMLQDEQILINNQWPIIFVHFSYDTITYILYGNDSILKPLVSEYIHCVENYTQKGKFISQIEKKYENNLRQIEPISLKIRRWLSKKKQWVLKMYQHA